MMSYPRQVLAANAQQTLDQHFDCRQGLVWNADLGAVSFALKQQ
jgi:hypothetical protein